MNERTFEHVQKGEYVMRRVAGVADVRLKVTAVDDAVIQCRLTPEGHILPEPWRFDRKTGVEIDEKIGWGVEQGVSGSHLVHPDGATDVPVRILNRIEVVVAKLGRIAQEKKEEES